MIVTTTLQAGQAQEYFERADFFRLLDSTGPVDVRFYSNGAEVALAEDVTEGYAEKFDAGQFDKIRISAAANTTVHFVTRLGNVVSYDKPPTGDVNVINNNGAFTHQTTTVSTTSVTVKAANLQRRYLLIANNDSTVPIWVRLDGGTAAVGTGVNIPPKGTYELQGFVPTGAITAIGEGGGNPPVTVTEG